jgi:hypothetical protein
MVLFPFGLVLQELKKIKREGGTELETFMGRLLTPLQRKWCNRTPQQFDRLEMELVSR